jgi:hypothetical protein
MLESGRLDEHQQRNYTAVMRKLCGNCGILPTSYMITDSLKTVGELAIAGGGFAEVWEGTHRGRRVAMKVLKVYLMSDQELLKKVSFGHPISICKYLISISAFAKKRSFGDGSFFEMFFRSSAWPLYHSNSVWCLLGWPTGTSTPTRNRILELTSFAL